MRRDAIPLPVRHAKDRAVMQNLMVLEAYRDARRVLFYSSFRSEVGTGEMIKNALESGKEVVLPRVDVENNSLAKHVINGLQELSPGYMGIPEPTAGRRVKVEEVDLLIVPGVAFDSYGWRIGYGGGYYDRLLPRVKGTKPVIALAYEEQLFEGIPHEDHDVGMDVIITDRRIMDCRG
jgi:5-formyltetrahydrofolate cyclo-ligase